MRCPGCKQLHQIWTKEFTNTSNPNHPKWSFDGDMEKPTFSPSLLINKNRADPERDIHQCHSFIRDGQWQFLSDCTHELAGKIVPMIPVWDDEGGADE